ncbi:MAG: BatD family protein, partial [Pirellulales bacterium]
SINVAANRAVVRVGDPISLSITIQGDGNLKSILLPDLAKQMGLGEQDFQIPTEKPAGTIDGNSKQFNVSVRVKNQDIVQIPALSFSWFDPQREEFVAATSKPIALQVMDTKIVSSADVFSKSDSNTDQDSAETAPDKTSRELDLIAGANLAIETDAKRLLRAGAHREFWNYLPPAIYGAVLLVGVVILLRSRRTDDSFVANRKKVRLNEIRKSIQRAGQQNGTQSFNDIAGSLREYIREYEPKLRTPIERLIAQCDNAVYAPSESVDEELVRQVSHESLMIIESGEVL